MWIIYKRMKIGLLRSASEEQMPKECGPRSSAAQPQSHLHIRTSVEGVRKYHFVLATEATKGQMYS